MVATLLDTAMGGACWSVLEESESFLTADLRVEFMRSARPGTLRAEGRVVQRNRRVAFCSAELYDGEGALLASSRCTQIIRRRSEERRVGEEGRTSLLPGHTRKVHASKSAACTE